MNLIGQLLFQTASGVPVPNSSSNTTNATPVPPVYVPAYPVQSTSPLAFDYKCGGNNWPTSYPNCRGSFQSPVNLDNANVQTTSNFAYYNLIFINQKSPAIFTLDQTINAKGNFSQLTLNDTSGNYLIYNGVGFQVHSPSEHFINGRLYDAEVQLIHTVDPSVANLTNNVFAIVSLLYVAQDGGYSSFFSSFNSSYPWNTFNFNMFTALQNDYSSQNSFITYQGSMTAPPCNETVLWFVMTNPISMSLQQLSALDANFRINKAFANGRGNNRYFQPIKSQVFSVQSFVNIMAIDLSMSSFFQAIVTASSQTN